MNFLSGFLGLCSAVGVGTATEIGASGYNRQPITFGDAVNGVSISGCGYDFGSVQVESNIVGRAIFDTPNAGSGNLLLILPHTAPRLPQGGSIDRGEAGYITLILSALAGFPDGASYSGSFMGGSSLGLCYDKDEIVGLTSTAPNPISGVTALPRGGMFLQVQASILSAGSPLTVLNGQLQGTVRLQGLTAG